jgi:6-phosphofructokinase 1
MKRIAVLTSGGDAPGMNAAIRSIVRTGIDKGWEVFGICHGYAGLIGGDMELMGTRSVSHIIQQGGTILGSARCPEFKTEEGRLKALRELHQHDVEALVVIGGNGSQTGAHALSQMEFPVVGVASTIDNDLYGSDVTIGVDTALNIALEAIDRLKVTATSHERAFLVEVMGRACGYLALQRGGAPGAFDRILATRLGAGAVDALARGEYGVLVGLVKDELCTTPLSKVVAEKKALDLRLMELARVLK